MIPSAFQASVRFSQHFKLGKGQAALDFVDIPLETDIPLFVDPYAFRIDNDPFSVDCHNILVDYFDLVVQTIRSGKESESLELLANLHEPNDTRLGMSVGTARGRGIGSDQARDLYDRLQRSKAVHSGYLQDLADCELLIPGISHDKISDIATNIIRGKLVDYTQQQCDLFGVPTQRIPSGMFWDPSEKLWRSLYADLPVYNDQRILLVPKIYVRLRPATNHQEYYRKFVLEYLKAEALSANTSLVRLLKNGKRTVYIKDLKKKYPLRACIIRVHHA